jgi:glycosyltransferase involved in cell wall biosynthesis
MPQAPLIDVLIPTYNPKPDHLAAALSALQNQTFQGWHAFIHDDCSSVNVYAMVEPFLKDPRFTFVESDKRLGIGGNWNACVRQTNSPVVAFLFQDDQWSPNYLADADAALEKNPSVGFVTMNHTYQIEGDMETAPLYKSVETLRSGMSAGVHKHEELLRYWIERELTPNIIGEPCFVVMRRSAMQATGDFLENMPQFLDVEYWLRLLLKFDWYFVPGKYGAFRVHSSGASAQNQETGQGLFDRLRCFEMLIDALNGSMKKLAKTSRNNALQTMIAKFFRRVETKKSISKKGGSGLLAFCICHPFLIAHALLRYMLSPKRN